MPFSYLAQQGSWGQEERHALPIYRGIRFTMVITGTDRSFRVRETLK
jgi:hypothetical protein